MADRIVLDTGPIIALVRAGALDLLGKLPLEFVAPIDVRDELDEGVRRGHPSVDMTWIRFISLVAPISPVALAELDRGEAAVLQLALEQQIAMVGIDERKGRRAGAAAGLRVTGTLGLLGRAKTHGIVPAVRPYVDRMQARSIWFDEELVRRFLANLGE
jgi:predicted nucleic acid-binding protein